MLSMPRGTDPLTVQKAAREFAQIELADHKYVMVLHDHQANPHVHISVRAESKHGKRLNPRKADLHRWRETFAAKLRERGIGAEATRQATRGVGRRYPELWQVKAGEDGRGQVSKHKFAAVDIHVADLCLRKLASSRFVLARWQTRDATARQAAMQAGVREFRDGLAQAGQHVILSVGIGLTN